MQICELTHIERVLSAFHSHENFSFISLALLTFQPHSVIVKQKNILPSKKHEKTKQSFIWREKGT